MKFTAEELAIEVEQAQHRLALLGIELGMEAHLCAFKQALWDLTDLGDVVDKIDKFALNLSAPYLQDMSDISDRMY